MENNREETFMRNFIRISFEITLALTISTSIYFAFRNDYAFATYTMTLAIFAILIKKELF